METNNSSDMDKQQSVPSRNLSINISKNKMEAYITISYSPIYKSDSYTLKGYSEKVWSPVYTINELEDELNKAGIIYGIIKENIEKCLDKTGASNILIAKGKECENGEDDILDIKFEIDKDVKKINKDVHDKVDFKNIGAVTSVNKGDIVAVRIPGKDGIDGRNIFGSVIKHKSGKRIKLRVSQGCELKNENTVIAAISGKPCMKNNTFYVYKVHEVLQDVTLETGNIIFLGDIIIQGTIREGMKVHSGNSVSVMRNVERSEIKGKADISIKGNVISSKITGGGEDTEKLKEIENLTYLENYLEQMQKAVEEIKKFNLLGYDVSDGQVIKILLENKFKAMPKTCLNTIALSVKNRQNGDSSSDKLLNLIKTKLIGLAPLNIKHYSELLEINDVIKEKINLLKNSLSLPVNVKIYYCQDSVINSSGDIIVAGRGSYVSNLYAHGNIYFTEDMSVVRGGTLKAGSKIRCKTVGSTGGVTTKLMVSEQGDICIDTAYENTIISVGAREFIIDYPSKNLHAYLDDKYELTIDRLKL